MDEKSVRIRVAGIVQGVNFRYSTRRQARALGLRGWVRNQSDGSVEAVATGPSQAVDRLVEWMRHGPSGAEVQRLNVEEGRPEPGETGFSIR